jgi:hypothetical protein
VKPNAGAGFAASSFFHMDVRSKGSLDVHTSINQSASALSEAGLSAAAHRRTGEELPVFHQKIVDTRFRQ